jgi:hypothetical protein
MSLSGGDQELQAAADALGDVQSADRLVAADGVADERLVPAARAWAIMDQGRP